MTETTYEASVKGVAGKLALVTGATRGIGHGVAKCLAEAGAHVIVTGRDEAKAKAAADEIAAAGGKVGHVGADLEDDAAIARLIPTVEARYGKLDILVNNAGIDADNPLAEHPLEDWRRIMKVNLEAPFLLGKAALPHFLEKGRGVIVNVSSIFGFVTAPDAAAYTPSKHGLIGLTKQMSLEWARLGVRVNSVAPGLIQTDMTRYIWDSEAGQSAIRKRIPAGRGGLPRDIGGPVVFLCSDAADFIHGHTIVVDGGALLD
ncbi:MAG: glucose 1-dehydrogenase [Proteobacteria bacterium]|nr:glucose 1-dehydrogenase [Pseudomonadota bacterium]